MIPATITAMAEALRRRSLSSSELTRFLLDKCKRLNPGLNCMITISEEQAMAQAGRADAALAGGEAAPLTGIPVIHKDVFCTEGVKSSCGSRMLDNFIAPYSATVVERLERAGMVMLGKSNMDEFAMGSSTETSFYGPTANPWDRERVPGGSSGGSACAVACRLSPAATGSDTGGSIRQPAALCGVTGLKPTYGRVSRHGMIAFASSLDQAGPITVTAEDSALLLQAIAGHDARDSTSAREPAQDYASALEDSIAGISLGVPRQCFGSDLDAGVGTAFTAALEQLQKLGAKVTELDMRHIRMAVPAYYVISCAECSSNLARYDGIRYGYRCRDAANLEDLYLRSRAEGFGREVKRRIMLGAFVLSAGYREAYYQQALKVRRLILGDFLAALEKVEVIVAPCAPTPAFPLGAKMDDPVTMYLSDLFTAPVSLAGLPAVSIPMGFSDGLPVGMQAIGGHFREARILNLAHQYQKAVQWHERAPPAAGAPAAHRETGGAAP